ncbi:hypothetical protein [Streptomyces phytophilus]|uniref:hypothetical protein n=1 Tax=Streptomyces phytophilus TaxID=722715 RepID=UPI0015F0AB81|nr:hypothetical protein [Streptomyces phytophilus]
MSSQPNDALRRAIRESGHTQSGLAEAVNDAHETLFGTPGDCSDRHIRRLLKGQVAWPQDRTRLPLEAVLGRTAAELGFTPPRADAADVTVRGPATAQEQEQPVHRRKFILSAGVLIALPALPESGRIGMSDVERVRGAEARLVRLDAEHGSARLADIASRYVGHIEHAMRHCHYSSRVQTALHHALGELCEEAGWLAYDSQQHEEARRHWRTALQYARLARAPELEARIWSSMSRQAVDLGHGIEAVAIARVALDATRGRRDPRLSALLHSRVALGHSVAGQRGRCGQSLHRAEQELDRASVDPPPWLAFCGPAELTGQAAMCAYHLGDYKCSAQAERDGLDLIGGFRRNQFAATVQLARSLHAGGEEDEAVAVGCNALELLPEVRSQRWVDQLDRLQRDIQARNPAGAAEFADRYRKAMA